MFIKTPTLSHPPTSSSSLGWLNQPFLILIVAQFISLIGTQLSVVALPWFVLSTTGSPGLMTIVLIAETLPIAVFGIPAGALVDRFNKKRLLVIFDISRSLIILIIPVLALLNQLDFWVIVVVAFVKNMLNAPYLSARMALVPALVGDDSKTLVRANTILLFTIQITTIIGSVLAGLLITLIGNINVLFVDGATFMLAGLLISFGVKYKAKQNEQKDSRPWLDELQAGLRFIWHERAIRNITLIGMFATLSVSVLITAVLPVFVKTVLHFEADTLGWLLSAWGAGSVIGMTVYGALAGRWPWKAGKTILYFMIGMILPLCLIPLKPTFVSALVGLGLNAFFGTPILVIIHTILQLRTPSELHGRVFAAFNALWLIITPMGLMVAGPLLERFGALTVMWGVIGLMVGCLGLGWGSRSVRGI